jgi:hypothetical protein
VREVVFKPHGLSTGWGRGLFQIILKKLKDVPLRAIKALGGEEI